MTFKRGQHIQFRCSRFYLSKVALATHFLSFQVFSNEHDLAVRLVVDKYQQVRVPNIPARTLSFTTRTETNMQLHSGFLLSFCSVCTHTQEVPDVCQRKTRDSHSQLDTLQIRNEGCCITSTGEAEQWCFVCIILPQRRIMICWEKLTTTGFRGEISEGLV